jgi:isopenicillin-N N-acyltransferase-like protein
MLRLLTLGGTPYEMGRQHGQQVADLRSIIIETVDGRLADLREHEVNLSGYVHEIADVWQRHARGTLEMLRGLVDALELDWEDYFSYVISSYLADRMKWPRRPTAWDEGCTTWAARGPFTVDGAPLMAKNRDQPPHQRLLQCAASVEPERGLAYLCVTTAGAPGVASSGINAAGLAVADTYVPSRDVGPGVGRYSLMMTILERCSNVEDALQQARGVPQFGNGNLIMLDARGDMAVLEIANSAQAELRSDQGFVVSTNHYTGQTTQRLTEPHATELRADSRERYARVETELNNGRGAIDLEWAKNLMGQHGGPSSAICRHADVDPEEVTISTVAFLPLEKAMHLTDGPPCETRFESFELNGP